MDNNKLKVLVVDDSISHRTLIKNILDAFSEVSIVDTVPNGEIAIRKMALQPADLVFIDLEMPGLSGSETAKQLQREFPGAYIIIVGETQQTQMEISMRVKDLGVRDGILKKDLAQNTDKAFKQYLRRLERSDAPTSRNASIESTALERLSQMSRNQENVEAKAKQPPTGALPALRPMKIDIVAIGVSTGGPVALSEVIPLLPGDLGVPVVLVQHMPPNFTGSLAETLAKKSSLQVKEASEGEFVTPNKVLIAPGGKHMVLKLAPKGSPAKCMVEFNMDAPENSCRPAADVLFRSVANCYNGNILAVIMTGMGSDGKEGVKIMKQQGCICLSQSAETCVVYGMPQAVDEAGLSDESVPLQKLADRITAIVRRPGGRS
jgi:two-component system, chemotaxis family, protein-glutamate methylesterase/glutaminase